MPTSTVGKRKIDYARKSSLRLLQGFHRPGFDRCCVMSFGNTARVDCDFTSNPSEINAAVESLTYINAKERTRFTTLWPTPRWCSGRRREEPSVAHGGPHGW